MVNGRMALEYCYRCFDASACCHICGIEKDGEKRIIGNCRLEIHNSLQRTQRFYILLASIIDPGV